MREGIAAHGGYEINTEGDAFHIAFTTVAQAVAFAMEAQVLCTAHHTSAMMRQPLLPCQVLVERHITCKSTV